MNYFARRNYARGQQKKDVESQFKRKTKDFTKSQFEDLLIFQSKYESDFEKLRNEFESFFSVNDAVLARATELAVDADYLEKEKQLTEVENHLKSRQKYSNASWLQKFDDEYKVYKGYLEFKDRIEYLISTYHNLDYSEVYQKYELDAVWRWRASKLMFVDIAFKEIYKSELRNFEKKFAVLGISFTPEKKLNLDPRYQAYQENPKEFIFHYRPIVIDERPPFTTKIPSFGFKFNYFEKWKILRTEKRFCAELIKKQISTMSKKDKERNLRALAAQKTEEQRSVASAQRSQHNLKEQTKIFKNCPYCQGILGPLSGKNAAHLDHIHPVSKGGLSTIQNLVYICHKCNREKSDNTLNHFIKNKSLNRENIFEVLEMLEKDF